MNEWGGWWRLPMAVGVGVLLAIVIDRLTEYFTGTHAAPVNDVKKAADTGPATLILNGISLGFESSVWSVLVIAMTIIASIAIFGSIDNPSLDAVGRSTFILYGVAMTGIGMLTLTGNNVAMDSFGPISDNANGIGEMAWSGKTDKATKDAQQIMADLDAVGNTTKAITKGVAIGSAVIAAVSLFGSFLVDVSRAQASLGIALAEQIQAIGIRVDVPQVFVGMLIGGALPWLFSSFAIQAVARAASLIVLEVRRQFKLGVLEGKVKPDYAQAVEISTTAAQKELVSLALLGIVTPIVVGIFLHVEALGGFLAGIIVSGQLLAVFLNNSGGAWDNAKKLIEDEPKDIAEKYWQRFRTSQGWRGGRYGWRSIQGYGWSRPQPDDQSRESCCRDHCADRRAISNRNRNYTLYGLGCRTGLARCARLGSHALQGSRSFHGSSGRRKTCFQEQGRRARRSRFIDYEDPLEMVGLFCFITIL